MEKWKNAGLHRPVKTVGLVVCRVVVVLWCILCELPTASLSSQARVYCGYRPGPTRVMPPPRQGGGDIRAPALACVLAVCARGHVCGRWFCGVVLPGFRTPPRTTSLALSFDLGQPRDRTCSSSHQTHSSSACTRDLEHASSSISYCSYRTFHSCRTLHVMSHLSAMRSLLIPSETCLSISPIRPFTLLDGSLSVTS